MTINNPYIEKVKNHKQIMSDVDLIYTHQGKWDQYFQNTNNIVLEIGTGLGNYFSREVQAHSENNYVGMEIKFKRLYITAEKSLGNLNNYAGSTRPKNILQKIEKKQELDDKVVLPPCSGEGVRTEESGSADGGGITEDNTPPNFVLLKDFGENIDKIFGDNELSLTNVFFPDPWAKKKRQLKHRLLQTPFLNTLYQKTKVGGTAVLKTDHLGYFEFILEELKATKWKTRKCSFDWENEEEYNNTETTEFQQLFRGQNIKINYIELVK